MKNFICTTKKIINTEHKYVELQTGLFEGKYEETDVFKFNIHWSRRVDHAGISIDLYIWNFYFMFQIYDNRHWCYNCDDYFKQSCYDEKHEEFADE